MADDQLSLMDDSVQARFWAGVDRRGDDDCWVWRAAVSANKYGSFSAHGKKFRASRYSLMLAGRYPKEGEIALHSCDNPPCCNPAHLRWGSYIENSRDAVERNRINRWNGARTGAANPNTRLTVEQVKAIKRDIRFVRTIAREYGIGPSSVRNIRAKRTWAHVEYD